MPGKIAALAKADDSELFSKALFLARYGREFTQEENELAEFYIYFEEMKRVKNLKSPQPESAQQWEKEVETAVKQLEEKIAKIFIEAVKTHDGQKIIRLANAAWFWQGKISSDYFAPEADKELFRILLLKRRCQKSGKSMAVREVAEHLAAQADKEFVSLADHTWTVKELLESKPTNQ